MSEVENITDQIPSSYYMKPDSRKIRKIIKSALIEDKAYNDITTKAIGHFGKRGTARIIAKQTGVISGIPIAIESFKSINKEISVLKKVKDGSRIKNNETVLIVNGDIEAILKAERTALNFLSHLSGISTLTAEFVKRLKGTRTKLLDTRKTLPGLREIEKYAVQMGGGENHRFDLSDMYLIKENHIAAAGGLENAIELVIIHRKRITSRRKFKVPQIEVEVTNLNELKIALNYDVDRIMLDNFTPQLVKKAILLVKKKKNNKIKLEASGGMDLSNISKYAATGVDYISVGALTHSAPAFNFSLLIDK